MLEINSPRNYISRTGEIALRAVYQEKILNDIGKDKKALKVAEHSFAGGQR